jgi:hypothetical protein
VIDVSPTAEQPTEFHNREELSAEQRDDFRSLLDGDFPKLLQPVNSPHVSRHLDHPIETTDPMKYQRLNILSRAERAELNQKLKGAIEASLIRPNHIQFGSPFLFVRKAHGSLRLCIDYRALKEVTRKDAYPLPRVDDTLDEHKDVNFYTHLDLASCFWQVRVRDEDVHKTAFQTPFGLIEWVAMPFGECNALATFERMMNDILRDFLHQFVTVYPDDVRIYSRTLDEHLEHLRQALQIFQEEGLKLRLKKCFFDLHEMQYLGYIVSTGKTPFRQRKSRPLQTGQCLRRRRRFAVLCNSATNTPNVIIILASLWLY